MTTKYDLAFEAYIRAKQYYTEIRNGSCDGDVVVAYYKKRKAETALNKLFGSNKWQFDQRLRSDAFVDNETTSAREERREAYGESSQWGIF